MSNRFLIGKGLEDGHTKCFSSFFECILHILIFHIVYVAGCEQREARETWQLLTLA
jgi:hypothetical protein